MPAVCQVNNIDIDLIYSDTIEENIISINTKKELFFDVYECTLNDEKLVLEKVGDSELGPKVLLEINIEGKKYSAEAILVDNGTTYIELNKENIYFIRTIPEETVTEEKNEIEEVDIEEEETSDNIEVNYENIIEHHVNNKLVFLHELEEQFEEKIVSLKDDISNKLDLFFEKLEDKKKVIVEEKLEKITANLDEKFITLRSELQGVEDFSKENIDKILENKIIEIDNSVSLFLEGITKEYKNKIISSDKKITHNFLELNSIKEKLKENNNTTNKKFEDLNLLKGKLLEQDELVLKNQELKKFITEEFENIDSKFKNLSEEESKKYDELLAAVNNKDVVEYKTILKEKIQDVELTQIKESLQEEISSALKGDIVSLKRYVEMSSGGGSTAKQFAAGGTMDGTLDVKGNILSGGTNLIDIFNSDTSINLQDVTDIGNTTTNLISSNNTIVADTILATNILSATNLDIGFELSGFNVTGSLSASGNISSGSLTNPALSTDGIDAKFTDNVIIAGDLDIGFPNENENQCITIHGSNSSGKRTQLIQTGGAFCIHPTVGNQCLILGSLSNHITMLCGNASHELRIPTGKVNIGTTGGTEKLTVAGNISASGGLSANNIFSGGLAVCTSQTTPTLQAVTDAGNTTTGGINVGGLLDFGHRTSNDIIIRAEADSHDLTLFRAAANSDAVGVSLIYKGSGNGDENIFQIDTDGGGSFKIDNSGDVGINTAPNDGVDLTTDTLSSINLSANNIAGNNVFSGGLPVCTSVPAPSTPTLQSVTTQGSTTTVSLSVAALSASGKIIGGSRTNSASGTDAAVLGGLNNRANGSRSVVGGGQNNIAKGTYSFIGGGNGNCTSIHPYGATVAGGMYNSATYYSAAVLGGTSNHASGAQSIVGGGTSNYACGTRSVAVGGRYSRAIGYESFVGSGYGNQACGNQSSIVGGSNNRTSGLCSSILGGSGNCINTGHNCSFIIGSNITSSAACTTFVNNLTSLGSLDGCSITSSEGVKVGGGSIISCTASFSPSLSDNGKTLLLDTTSGTITVSVTPQISGYSARYIKEAGAAPVVFSTGANLSGLYSYLDRNQMSIIYAQADIFYKNENYAFIGGNLE